MKLSHSSLFMFVSYTVFLSPSMSLLRCTDTNTQRQRAGLRSNIGVTLNINYSEAFAVESALSDAADAATAAASKLGNDTSSFSYGDTTQGDPGPS